ncbi:MAG: calcium-binding protein [Myxococcales bacterium]|nr:calcium-binding protein [Myxococcales bacterium]
MSRFFIVATWGWLSAVVLWGCSESNGDSNGVDGSQDVVSDIVLNDIAPIDGSSTNDVTLDGAGSDGNTVDTGVGNDTGGDEDTGAVPDVVSPTDSTLADGETDLGGTTDISPTDGGEADMGTPPPGCCAVAGDCDIFGSPVAHVCAPTIEGTNAAWGVCKPTPPSGRCWGNNDCKPGQICHNPNVCPCGAQCAVADLMGVCTDPQSACTPIQSEWVEESCNAANIVIWDGNACVATCPGCCGCAPFCDLTFSSLELCEKSCLADECLYIGALAESPYGYTQPGGTACPTTFPLESRCKTDADCAQGSADSGKSCVFGNCVYCAGDAQCELGEICRAGRCVPAAAECPPTPPCSEFGCFLITPSESPCPICVCDSIHNKACTDDQFCMMFSSVKYEGCIYGRCAVCRNDKDCTVGHCLPPGLCYQTTPELHHIYGTWLIGWPGGLDHFSYFRFEPDGTLRRGHYLAGGTFMDDFPQLPCGFEEMPTDYPLLGSWEPEVTQSGFLVIRVHLNVSCDVGGGYAARFNVTLKANNQADFYDIDTSNSLMGVKLPPETCAPDFSICETPTFEWFLSP